MNRMVIEPVLSCTAIGLNERFPLIKSIFGEYFSEGEHKVFWWMEQITDCYAGGLWDFYRISNGAGFMSPRVPSITGKVSINAPSGDAVCVSESGAGIIVTLLALAYLSYEVSERGEDAEHLRGQYNLLREYACGHPEAASILLAAD